MKTERKGCGCLNPNCTEPKKFYEVSPIVAASSLFDCVPFGVTFECKLCAASDKSTNLLGER